MDKNTISKQHRFPKCGLGIHEQPVCSASSKTRTNCLTSPSLSPHLNKEG